MKYRKRRRGVKSKRQSQKRESLSLDSILLESKKSVDNELVATSIKDRDILNYVNLYPECLKVIGIETVLAPSNELNSKNFTMCEVIDMQEMHLAYEFFMSEILSKSVTLTEKSDFTKEFETFETQYSVNKSNLLNSHCKLQQKVSNDIKNETKKISLSKNHDVSVENTNNLISENESQLEINKKTKKASVPEVVKNKKMDCAFSFDKISNIDSHKSQQNVSNNIERRTKQIILSKEDNPSENKSNNLISKNDSPLEINNSVKNKTKKISVSKAVKAKELDSKLSFPNVSNKDSDKSQQKVNIKKGIKKIFLSKLDNMPLDKSISSISESVSQLKFSNSIKMKTKTISEPKAVKNNELDEKFLFDNVSIDSDKNQSMLLLKNSLKDMKSLKITFSNQNSLDESGIKEKRNGFKDYSVIIKSNNILCNERNCKLSKNSVDFNENKTTSSHISKDIGCYNTEDFSNRKTHVLSEKLDDKASFQTISKNEEEDVDNNIENSSVKGNEIVPNDYLALAKHMKVTLKDSKRTLKISPNKKNDSQKYKLKRKFTAITSENSVIKSNAIERPSKIRKIDDSLNKKKSINVKKYLDKNKTLDSTTELTNTIIKDSLHYEDDILSTIMDKEVLLELQDEENVLSSEELVSPEKCDHSFDTSFSIDNTSSNYNLQMVSLNTSVAAESDSSSDSESSFKRKKNKNSYQFQRHLNKGLSKDSNSANFLNSDNQSNSNLDSVSDRNSSCSSSSFTKLNVFLSPATKTLNNSSEVNQASSTSTLESKVFQTGNLNEVLKAIGVLCIENNAQKAVSLAQRYLPLRNSEEKLNIFISLFINIINSTKKSDRNLNSESYKSLYNDVYLILNENNLYNSKVCSAIICESFSSGLKLPIAFHVVEKCIDSRITISEEAILTYADFLYFQENISGLIAVSDYARTVCDMDIPKPLLNYLLKLSAIKFNCLLEPQFEKLCNIFCNFKLIEIDDSLNCDMKKFFKCCVEKDNWQLISSIFTTWATKGMYPYIQNIYFALAASSETMGNNFEKFAAVLLGDSSCNQNEIFGLFSQIGVSLMLEAYVNNNLDSALKILILFHFYNVNYLGFHLSFSQIYSDAAQKLFITNSISTHVSKETIIHTVVNILKHFGRPRDAFDICQGIFESVLSDMDDSDLKTYLLLEKYTTILKIAPLLISTDLLGRGLTALHILLSVEEQGLTMESVESFSKKVSEIYNRCLASLLNEEKSEIVLELLDRKYGEFKEQLRVFHCVRRGLVVTYSNNGMIEKAKKLFFVGFLKKSYLFPKINNDEYPPYLTIRSCMSSYEIKFAIELYFQKIQPFLKSKDKGAPMKCFSIRIRIRPHRVDTSLVNCLQNIPSDFSSCEKRIRDVLINKDPTLECVEKIIEAKTTFTKFLEISPDIFYNYWKSKLCSPVKNTSDKDISVNFKKRISFGMSEPERKAEDFKKITQFLLAKLSLQHEDLNAEKKQQKAERLAISFIRENQVLNKLDRRTMKLLSEFSEKLV